MDTKETGNERPENLDYEIDYNEDEGDPLAALKQNREIGDALSNVAMTFDALGMVISWAEMIIVDGAAVILIGGGCLEGGPAGCAAGAIVAWGFDLAVMSNVNPLAAIENILGGGSLLATGAADGFFGNTNISEGRIGVDTIVSLRNAIAGLAPEANVDFALSASQLNYDLQRSNGTKPGGSVNIFSMEFLAKLIWEDWW